MKLSHRAEEILGTLWIQTEEAGQKSISLGLAKGGPEIEELRRGGYVKLADDRITLIDKGRSEGEKIIRRHRLAERLFADVLDVKKKLIHSISCQFEHILHEGIEDNICILLGHPKTCPHGRSIPPGACCQKSKEITEKIIISLARLEAGQKGTVAYIHTNDRSRLQKFMAMGVLPGMNVALIQKFPSYVFQVGQSQFAIDKELAEGVYVRLEK